MVYKQVKGRDSLIRLVRKAIELLADKNVSQMLILSSYKINSVLQENFGVRIKVDIIGRILGRIAKLNQLKRLNTNIPKYRLNVSKVSSLQFF
ncbi:hypothetical protein LCGC14_0943800 [marine sediment metagenome]|uniref:Uncharacterized protein n=1 Tax=marine sediment metagenome TaxID=412755 RepID=A0A0F9NJ96_9ZZZZ|nr:hypothetical protein [bacterium]